MVSTLPMKWRMMLPKSSKWTARITISRTLRASAPKCRTCSNYTSPLITTRPRLASIAHLPSPWHSIAQIRGAKRKSTVDLDDIPQGAIPGSPLPPINDEPEYPPLLQQVRNNMIKFNHCVLLTRVGGFYEVWRSAERETPLMVVAVF